MKFSTLALFHKSKVTKNIQICVWWGWGGVGVMGLLGGSKGALLHISRVNTM